MVNRFAVRLPIVEWERIVRLGTERHAEELEAELRAVRQQIAELEWKYGMPLKQLQQVGLPDDAGMEAHEDYVAWSSLEGYAAEPEQKLEGLR
jgi:hypothetical protein